jgi:hypothetical protein
LWIVGVAALLAFTVGGLSPRVMSGRELRGAVNCDSSFGFNQGSCEKAEDATGDCTVQRNVCRHFLPYHFRCLDGGGQIDPCHNDPDCVPKNHDAIDNTCVPVFH